MQRFFMSVTALALGLLVIQADPASAHGRRGGSRAPARPAWRPPNRQPIPMRWQPTTPKVQPAPWRDPGQTQKPAAGRPASRPASQAPAPKRPGLQTAAKPTTTPGNRPGTGRPAGTANTTRALSVPDQNALLGLLGNQNLNAAQKNAVLRLLAGTPLTQADRNLLAGLVRAPGTPGALSPAASRAIGQGLRDDSNRKLQQQVGKQAGQGNGSPSPADSGSQGGGTDPGGAESGGQPAATSGTPAPQPAESGTAPVDGSQSPAAQVEGAGNPDAAAPTSSPAASPDATAPTSSPAAVLQTRRYLSVKNDTDKELQVSIQYRTLTDQQKWAWFPEDPQKSDKAFMFKLAAGQTVQVAHPGWRVNASRVRIWATSADTRWDAHKTTDLWLVPEQAQNGRHSYLAPEMETYTFSFSP